MSQLLSLRGVPTSNSLGVIDERVLVVSDTHEALKAAVTGALPGCVAVCRLCRARGVPIRQPRTVWRRGTRIP
jgi:hypothetical protein